MKRICNRCNATVTPGRYCPRCGCPEFRIERTAAARRPAVTVTVKGLDSPQAVEALAAFLLAEAARDTQRDT